MNISPIQNIKFNGSVKLNKAKIAKEIAKIEKNNSQYQVDSVIGNINTLCGRLTEQTPDSAKFSLIVNVDKDCTYRRLQGISENYVQEECKSFATGLNVDLIDVKNNINYRSYVKLGCPNDEYLCLDSQASGEDIWKEGFEKITKRAIYNANAESAQSNDLNEEEKSIFNRLI